MRPCWKNRKTLAWLALGELGEEEAGKLRAHLQSCDPCRERFEELSGIAQELSSPPLAPELQPRPSFHRGLVAALREQHSQSSCDLFATPLWRPVPNWAAALAVCLVLVAAFLLWSPSTRRPGTLSQASSGPPRLASVPTSQEEPPAPTISNYRLAANRSLDELDELLTRQARQCAPATPLFTASSSGLASK